jgi:hypothetical protein
MPLQNRVTPWGTIVADPARGLFLGNRGCLCDAAGRLATRRWRLQAWITCALSYKGWWRPVMQPAVWTELFFLDEATALAAGHRPCALCRREAYNSFVAAWQQGNRLSERPRAVAIDKVMHNERVHRNRSKVTFACPVSELPAGAMIEEGGVAWLLGETTMRPWSPAGYGQSRQRPSGLATVLTPASTVAALRAGYQPVLHPSAAADT